MSAYENPDSELRRARAAQTGQIVGQGAQVAAEALTYGGVRAGQAGLRAGATVVQGVGTGLVAGAKAVKESGIDRHIVAAAGAAAPHVHRAGEAAVETGVEVAIQGGKAIKTGVGIIVENREQIGAGVQAGVRGGVQAGVVAVGCMGKMFGAAWNNSCNVIRPFCAQCEVGLTGGCGEWQAYLRPGCEHLICYACQYKGQQYGEYAPCIKCYAKPKKGAGQNQGCFSWLWGKQVEAPQPEPDYIQGYVTTGDVVESLLPEIARKIALQYQLDENELLANMTDSSSKNQLSVLSQNRLVPVLL